MFGILKSQYAFKMIIKDYLDEKRYLSLFKYNKKYQKILEITLKDYEKKFLQIEIELVLKNPLIEEENIFVQIKENNQKAIHIYINNKEENKNSIKKDEYNNTTKIKLVLDYNVFSFAGLFRNCKCIQEINFIKFNKEFILDMYEMFKGCESLSKLNVSKFKTQYVSDMGGMFYGCSSLQELDLSNFIFDNVNNTFEMFAFCTSLKKLNLNNFKVTEQMNTRFMFSHCLEELKTEIMNKFKDLKETSYWDYVEE